MDNSLATAARDAEQHTKSHVESQASGDELARIERLTEVGLRVLPCKGKRPFEDDWPNKATADIDRIASWLRHGYNLGATTPDDTILHIDVDRRNGGFTDDLDIPLECRNTWAYMTGGEVPGPHILYKVPTGVTLGHGKRGVGIDVLWKGKQGIIPPSVHPDTGNPYQWVRGHSPLDCELLDAPPHLLDRLHVFPTHQTLDFINDVEITAEGRAEVQRDLEGCVCAVERARPGKRHNRLRNLTAHLKGYVHTGYLSDEDVARFMLAAARSGGYDEKHLKQVVTHVLWKWRGGEITKIPQWPMCDLARGIPQVEKEDYENIKTNLQAGDIKEACDLFEAIRDAFDEGVS